MPDHERPELPADSDRGSGPATPPVRRRRMKLWVVIVAVLMGGFIALMPVWALVVLPAIIHSAVQAGAEQPVTVEYATAVEAHVATNATGIGSVAAVHQVTVAPEVAGKIIELMFQSGATVKEGTPLIRLNDAPERADLANFEAQARLADLNLKRSRQLNGQEFASRQTVDQDAATMEQAAAGIAKNQALIDQKLIRAPFSGVLGVRQVDLGQEITAGGAIVTLTDLDQVYVNFTLPERERPRIAVGQTVEVSVDAYPGRVFAGILTAIEPQISADTRNLKLQATLDNPDHALLPGMFANAALKLPPRHGVVVPETAVDYGLYGTSAYVILPEAAGSGGRRVHRIVVRTGDHADSRVLILDGIKPGDEVVTSGQLRLTDGARVVPAKANLLQPPTGPAVR